MLLLALASAVAGDQVSKALVLATVGEGRVLALGPLRVRPVVNRRTLATAFGLRPSHLLLLWIAILVAAILAPPHIDLLDSALSQLGLGVALGGAASNLLDHVARGGVVDFIDVRPWPASNLADVAIASGVTLALLG